MDLFHYYNPNDAQKRWERIDWYKADIREIESLHDCFIGVKQVYHCAVVSLKERFQKMH